MRPTVRTIRDGEEASRFFAFLGNMPYPYTASVVAGAKRSLDQNALLHVLFSEIAKQRDDMTLLDIKGECHRKFGLPIKLQDPQFAWVWEQTGAKLPYEKQCKYLASGVLNVSSRMTKPQLTQYIDEMVRDYREAGFTVTLPEGQ